MARVQAGSTAPKGSYRRGNGITAQGRQEGRRGAIAVMLRPGTVVTTQDSPSKFLSARMVARIDQAGRRRWKGHAGRSRSQLPVEPHQFWRGADADRQQRRADAP